MIFIDFVWFLFFLEDLVFLEDDGLVIDEDELAMPSNYMGFYK